MVGGSLDELFEYARGRFLLEFPLKGSSSGASQEAHLRQAAKSLGEDPEQFVSNHLNGSDGEEREEGKEPVTECPFGFDWYLRAFSSVANARSYSQSGPNPIPWTEMECWTRIQRVDLAPWEADVLSRLDVIWLNTWNGRFGSSGTED